MEQTEIVSQIAQEATDYFNALIQRGTEIMIEHPDFSSLTITRRDVDAEILSALSTIHGNELKFDKSDNRISFHALRWPLDSNGVLYLHLYSKQVDTPPAESFEVVVDGKTYKFRHD